MGHATEPVAHRGCTYNTENFYDKLVIHEKDQRFVVNKKKREQDKLMDIDESGLSQVERLILGRTPEEVQSYMEFIKHATDHTFDASSKSGMDPKKMLKGIRVKK